ncbi:MAG: hypothetical protein KGZ25_11365, partial [Planctomycetes bacterium]|nr:hypothetical protein [Planctomycetota bacterium]
RADMTKIAQSMEPGQRPDAEELSVDIVEKEADSEKEKNESPGKPRHTDRRYKLLRYADEWPLNVNAHRTQRFFIDVKVPEDAPPGTYRGKITIEDSEGVIATVPLQMRVYPFKLAPPRQTYWIWRLTWSPLWEPQNVKNLGMIREAGFNGLTIPMGPKFRYYVEDGQVKVDGTPYRRTVKTLRNAGLDPTLRYVNCHVLEPAMKAAGVPELVKARIKHLEQELKSLMPSESDAMGLGEETQETDGLLDDLTGEKRSAEKRQKRIEELTALLKAIKSEPHPCTGSGFQLKILPYADPAIRREWLSQPHMRTIKKLPPPALVDEDLPDGRTVKDVVNDVKKHMRHGLRQVKRIAEDVNAKLYIFPVDEPDGTPSRRVWTRFLAEQAHAAGMKVWSTHNSPKKWQPGIDISAPGCKIFKMYMPRERLGKRAPSKEMQQWYRKNVKSTYNAQVRYNSIAVNRLVLGIQAWAFYGLEEITAFCYDWNFRYLFSVYPKGGNRGADRWYPTQGWRAIREGIDDARYLHTLELLYRKRGMNPTEAREAVAGTLGPVDHPASWNNHGAVLIAHGSFDAMRRRVAEKIIELQDEKPAGREKVRSGSRHKSP